MKRIPFILLMTFFVFGVGCKEGRDSHDHEGSGKAESTAYHCPMHPQIIQEKPGECPICGMDLVKITSQDPAASQADSITDALLNALDSLSGVIQGVYIASCLATDEDDAISEPIHGEGLGIPARILTFRLAYHETARAIHAT